MRSSEAWQATPASCAALAMPAIMGLGPQVMTRVYSPVARSSAAGWVVKPCTPREPSSVVTTTWAPSSSSSGTPQSLSAVWAPSTAVKGTSFFASSRPAATTGGAPTPPATSRTRPASGKRHPWPQGPRTVEPSPASRAARRRVPSPTAAKTSSTVPRSASAYAKESGTRTIWDGSPGTAMLTNWPGRSRAASSGAAISMRQIPRATSVLVATVKSYWRTCAEWSTVFSSLGQVRR